MQCRKPPCGNRTAHPSHWAQGRSFDGASCPGWTQAEADTCALIDHLNEAGFGVIRGTMPEGITLVCHPSVENALIQMVEPDYAAFVSGQEPWKPQFPVEITTELAEGEWRLVLADGKIGSNEPVGRR